MHANNLKKTFDENIIKHTVKQRNNITQFYLRIVKLVYIGRLCLNRTMIVTHGHTSNPPPIRLPPPGIHPTQHTYNTPKPKSGHFCLKMFTQLSQPNASGQAPITVAARHNML